MKMRFFPLSVLLCLLVASTIVVGCGKQAPKDFPPTVPFKLVVTNGETPLSGAAVSLIPEKPEGAWFAGATTDARGVAEINTMLGVYQQSGVPAGAYKVTITKSPDVADTASETEIAKMSPIEFGVYQAEIEEKRAAAPRLFHPMYSSAVETPLRIEVKSGTSEIKIQVGAE